MTISPKTATISAGETQQFTVKLLDAADQETAVEAGSEIGFAADVSSVAAVTANVANPNIGDAYGRRKGSTPVRAFYVRGGQQTNIFAAADLTVVDAAGEDAGTSVDAAVEMPPPVICPAGRADCDSNATNPCEFTLAIDHDNCGACGHACSADQVCANGGCAVVAKCQLPAVDCGGVCSVVSEDPKNCGTCGNACGADQVCQLNKCSSPSECFNSSVACNGACVTFDEFKNCGACGHACGAGETCYRKECGQCTVGFTSCDGTCRDTNRDQDNCGGCLLNCTGTQACVSGRCLDNATPEQKEFSTHSGGCHIGGPLGHPVGWIAVGTSLMFGAALGWRRRRRASPASQSKRR